MTAQAAERAERYEQQLRATAVHDRNEYATVSKAQAYKRTRSKLDPPVDVAHVRRLARRPCTLERGSSQAGMQPGYHAALLAESRRLEPSA